MPEPWTIPRMLLRERASIWRRGARIIVPGATGDGFMPTVEASGGGIWINENEEVNLRTPGHVRLWRAIEEYLAGGATPIVVPMCDRRQYPAPAGFTPEAVPHSDDTPHSDGTGYAQPFVDVELDASAALRATTADFFVLRAGDIRPGMFFSILHPTWHWRLYRIQQIVETLTGDVMTVKFGPGLREAAGTGTKIEFDTPRCLMKLPAEDAFSVSIRERRFASPSWRFVEAGRPDLE